LAPGREADVSVMDVLKGRFELKDNTGANVTASEMIVPAFALRAGRRFDATSPLIPVPARVAAGSHPRPFRGLTMGHARPKRPRFSRCLERRFNPAKRFATRGGALRFRGPVCQCREHHRGTEEGAILNIEPMRTR